MYKKSPRFAKAAEEVDNNNRDVLREREIQGHDEIRESVKEDARRLFRAPVTDRTPWKDGQWEEIFRPSLSRRVKIFMRNAGRIIDRFKRWAKNGFKKPERVRRFL